MTVCRPLVGDLLMGVVNVNNVLLWRASFTAAVAQSPPDPHMQHAFTWKFPKVRGSNKDPK